MKKQSLWDKISSLTNIILGNKQTQRVDEDRVVKVIELTPTGDEPSQKGKEQTRTSDESAQKGDEQALKYDEPTCNGDEPSQKTKKQSQPKRATNRPKKAITKVTKAIKESEQVDFSKISEEISRPKGIERYLGDKDGRKPYDLSEIEIIPEYELVLKKIMEKCPAIFVTGKAGTGKTTLIHFLLSKIQKSAVVAPTALAAINAGGYTIHSFFGIPPRALNPDETFNPKSHIIPVIKNLDVLIIDEVSMVSPDLIDCISNSLIKARSDTSPFGGVPIVFTGDLFQLPPIINDEDVGIYYTHRYKNPFFFSAEIFNRIKVMPIELTKVFRQQDLEFIQALDKIRINRSHDEALNLLNKLCYHDNPTEVRDSIFLVPTNAAADSINKTKLDQITEPSVIYNAIVHGEMEFRKRHFPVPDRLELKPGAKVLFRKNNKPLWLNGTLGEVLSLEEGSIKVKILATGNIVSVSRESWNSFRYKYDYETRRIENEIVGSFQQFPLTLGWAFTIHKSQGMTLDSVRIDLGRGASWCAGMTYVALSRVRSINDITLEKPISMSDVKAEGSVIEFYQKLGFIR